MFLFWFIAAKVASFHEEAKKLPDFFTFIN